ncbi:MAG: hypothetical protein JWP44_3776 [Mucilaginibacter sp.]|nr:hypothetical protein [Mucilaginibacter sp.]
MWICPVCNQQFVNTNQVHSCRDKELANFLDGKSQHTIELFDYLVKEYPTDRESYRASCKVDDHIFRPDKVRLCYSAW